MAEIKPFRALHYDTRVAGDLKNLVTQPYDKITPEMQAAYYAASPYNLTRVIRRRADPAEGDPYTAAAREFRGWIQRGILRPGESPAIYPYDQEYAVPGQAGVHKRRRGFIGLCKLEDYSAGIVHRHEETLSGPKADRMSLLRATRAHFGQIFFLYSDPEGIVERELGEVTRSAAPWQSVEDEYETRHEVWRLTESATLLRIESAMRERKLVIADGHHRYETALAYRNRERAEGGSAASDYVMATFVRMESEGLTILPTHRVVHGLPGFEWSKFVTTAEAFFEVKELAPERLADAGGLSSDLATAGHNGPAFVVYAGSGHAAILILRSGAAVSGISDTPHGLLDVVVLHRLLLERVLGIDREAVSEERNLHYERDLRLALDAVSQAKAQVCFLVNPTPIEAVRNNAFAGQVMPQKSTDFYPKLLSGLTIFDLDG